MISIGIRHVHASQYAYRLKDSLFRNKEIASIFNQACMLHNMYYSKMLRALFLLYGLSRKTYFV